MPALLDINTETRRYCYEEEGAGPVSPSYSTSSSSRSTMSVSPAPSEAPPSPTSATPSPSSSVSPTPTSGASPSGTPEKSRARARKPYRMASSFELGDEQPLVTPNLRKAKGDSYNALFGPPPPRFSHHRRSVSAAPAPTIQRRSRKPLPVNPLTGEQLGSRTGLDVGDAPQPCTRIPNFSRFKRPPPGGFTSQLW